MKQKKIKIINNLNFELFYSPDNYCGGYNSLNKAISVAISTIENNRDMIDRDGYYYILLNEAIKIVTIKCIDGSVVIE